MFETSSVQTDALKLEDAHSQGICVEGLHVLQFMEGSDCTLCYLINEDDLLKGSQEALKIWLRAHLGDTTCLESTLSPAKDALRDSRQNFRSRMSKYYHCIEGKLLQSRNTQHLQIGEAALAHVTVNSLKRKVQNIEGVSSCYFKRLAQEIGRNSAGLAIIETQLALPTRGSSNKDSK